jgi:hypothetical protein
MAKNRFCVLDSNIHITEPPDLWTDRISVRRSSIERREIALAPTCATPWLPSFHGGTSLAIRARRCTDCLVPSAAEYRSSDYGVVKSEARSFIKYPAMVM